MLLAGGLILANAFFVVAEFSLVRVRPTRLQELADQGHGAARVALRLIENMGAVVSTGQLGVTMASLALGWAGEQAVADALEPFLGKWAGHILALGIAFIGISTLHITLGELVPKSLALARADRLAMLIARPMEVYVAATWPVMRFVNQAAGRIARMVGATPRGAEQQVHSAEELKMLVTAGAEDGVLPEAQEAMIHRLFDLNQVLAREIMVPRPKMVCVALTATLPELVRLVQGNNYSRMPVYEGSPEKIVGILSVKELFRVWAMQLSQGKLEFRMKDWLRPPLIVPETKPVDELLQEFRERRTAIAVVVDEFGRTAGLVTMEDVLEAIVGEMEDEYDVYEGPRFTPDQAPVEMDGGTTLLDLENLYGVTLPRELGFETLAGFLMWRLGSVPKGGESIVFEGYRFTVLEMERLRIKRVRVEKA